MLTVGMSAVRAHVPEPVEDGLVEKVAPVGVVVAAAHDEPGLARNPGQIFGDDDDLRVQIRVCGEVEQIACQDDRVISARDLQQPVVLPQIVMQVRSDERRHDQPLLEGLTGVQRSRWLGSISL